MDFAITHKKARYSVIIATRDTLAKSALNANISMIGQITNVHMLMNN